MIACFGASARAFGCIAGQSVAFDTLKLAERLGEGGFTPKQAQATALALAEALSVDVATKVDIEALRLQIEARIAAVEGKISEAKADIVKWMFATIGFQTLVMIATLFGPLKFYMR